MQKILNLQIHFSLYVIFAENRNQSRKKNINEINQERKNTAWKNKEKAEDCNACNLIRQKRHSTRIKNGTDYVNKNRIKNRGVH